ncbi:MAG: hypothetical protein F6K53_07060 [Moorea sp. SIO4A1]|nr:hypothetical protein [Moorena sp. SIO4A1]NEQ57186.1 hypothetical protein [Moorena sp. SIO4A1]
MQALKKTIALTHQLRWVGQWLKQNYCTDALNCSPAHKRAMLLQSRYAIA